MMTCYHVDHIRVFIRNANLKPAEPTPGRKQSPAILIPELRLSRSQFKLSIRGNGALPRTICVADAAGLLL